MGFLSIFTVSASASSCSPLAPHTNSSHTNLHSSLSLTQAFTFTNLTFPVSCLLVVSLRPSPHTDSTHSRQYSGFRVDGTNPKISFRRGSINLPLGTPHASSSSSIPLPSAFASTCYNTKAPLVGLPGPEMLSSNFVLSLSLGPNNQRWTTCLLRRVYFVCKICRIPTLRDFSQLPAWLSSLLTGRLSGDVRVHSSHRLPVQSDAAKEMVHRSASLRFFTTHSIY